MPVIFKKVLSELKIISYLLFVSVIIFIAFLGLQILNGDIEKYNPDPKPRGYYTIIWGWDSIAAFSVFLCAFNFSFVEFPLYHALGPDRSKEKMMKAIGMGVI